MSTTAKYETEIRADERVPSITIVRDFDAPRELVYRAWTDPELFARWIGPRALTTDISRWDCHRGGSWAYRNSQDGKEVASFYGSFHEVVAPERLVQTFTYEGWPEGVALETCTLQQLDDGRTRVVTVSLADSFEARDAMLSSGMDVGVNEGYEKLDELLAEQQ